MKEAVPLVKNILAPLGITAAVSAIDAGIQKKKKKKKKNGSGIRNNDINFKRRNERHNENRPSSWRF